MEKKYCTRDIARAITQARIGFRDWGGRKEKILRRFYLNVYNTLTKKHFDFQNHVKVHSRSTDVLISQQIIYPCSPFYQNPHGLLQAPEQGIIGFPVSCLPGLRGTPPDEAEVVGYVLCCQVFDSPPFVLVCEQLGCSPHGRPSHCRKHCAHCYQSTVLQVGWSCVANRLPLVPTDFSCHLSVVPIQSCLQLLACVPKPTVDFTVRDAVVGVSALWCL